MNSEFITGKKRIYVYLLFILLGVLLTFLSFLAYRYNEKNKIELENQKIKREFELKNKKIKERTELKKNIFSTLDLKAEGVYLLDLSRGEKLFSKNENRKLGVASLTKIASADIVLEDSEYKENGITISRSDLKNIGDNGLIAGETFPIDKALNFMMIVSSNDLANSLTHNKGKDVFIKEMNRLAEKLGLRSTLFFSVSGLDISPTIAGSYSSAKDIAFLTKYFYEKYPNISEEFSKFENEVCSDVLCHKIKNTNRLLEKIPYRVLFSKTGYTEKTGGALSMIVEINGHKILGVVLSSGKEGRFNDMEKLFMATEEYLNKV